MEQTVKKFQWDEMEDRDLVKYAQGGEREAFGELVRRHRSKVYGYARTITRESYLAEDIVQEALMRAFMHLGKLVDVQRFLPWVHRIVRNHAYTRLKGNSARREQTFTELEGIARLDDPGADLGKWNNLDSILGRLNHSACEAVADINAPEERIVQQETLRVLTDIIKCLNPRERLVFESHFFDQLSPQEIAELFQLSSANVYQIISRSRKKVVQEKIRVTVDSYIKTRRDLGIMKKKILPYEESRRESRTWTSAADATYKMLQFTDRSLSLSMVMGLTGHAFRINIIPNDVHIAGPTAFYFGEVLSRGLHNLGFTCKYVDGMSDGIGPNANLLDSTALDKGAMNKRSIHQELPRALDLIHASLDRGYPVLAWDIFFPEFGLLYGYDDETRTLYGEVCGRVDTLAYENLGRSVMEDLFVLAIESPMDVTLGQQVQRALETAIEHYEGREGAVPNAVKGVAAYDAWIEALQGNGIEPNGHAYNIEVLRDARYYGAEFFKELTSVWPSEIGEWPDLAPKFEQTRVLYTEMCKRFSVLHQMFPFPEGGDPKSKAQATKAISLIQEIKELEIDVVAKLKEMYAALSK
ncbi:RNA polymerase sigma factor [Paenibacillus solani]|uniref:RNA polymerase sigma factor n=1 Tax=Paenibacillus solani TaxID=1705565 RepID=UPI003D2BA0DD